MMMAGAGHNEMRLSDPASGAPEHATLNFMLMENEPGALSRSRAVSARTTLSP